MDRKSFLKRCLAAGSLLVSPFASRAQDTTKTRAGKGFKVDGGVDRSSESISLYEGDTFYRKVSTKDTNGDFYLFESTRAKKGGPPMHYHFDQDEWWYVLEGEFLIRVGDDTFTAKAGDSVFGPRMVPHAFAKTNEGSSRLLMAFQPAGQMEAFFEAVSKGALTLLSDEEKAAFRQRHGFKVVGPALAYDKTPK